MDVRLPDGTVVKGVPDGISKAELATKLKANGMNVPDDWMAGPKPTPTGQIPIEGGGASLAGDRGAAPEPKQPLWKQALNAPLGAADAALSMGSGALASLGGQIQGAVKGMAPGNIGTGNMAGEKEAQRFTKEYTYQPLTESGQQILQGLGDINDKLKIPAQPLGGMGAMLGQSMKQGMGVAGDMMPKPGLPAIDPEVVRLARIAKQNGIEVAPDTLSKNKFARMAGETSRQVPLSGSKAPTNQEAFNRWMIRMIGGDEKSGKLTSDVYAAAMKKSGSTIGDISANTPIKGTENLINELAGFVDESSTIRTPDVHRVLSGLLQDVGGKVIGGEIDGTAFRNILSKVRRAASTDNGDLRAAIGEFDEILKDHLERNIESPEVLKQLRDARMMYARGKTIQDLVAKSSTGDVSPAQVMGRVTANGSLKRMMASGNLGEMGDAAKVGQLFLKDPGSSGTAERSLAYGLLGGGPLINHPMASAGVYGGANLYNRFGSKLTDRLVGKAPEDLGPRKGLGPQLTADQSPFPPSNTPPRGVPGRDPFPWSTSPGVNGPQRPGYVPGLHRSVDELPPLPQGIPQRPGSQIPIQPDRPLGDLTPDWSTSRGVAPENGRWQGGSWNTWPGRATSGSEPGLTRSVDEARTSKRTPKSAPLGMKSMEIGPPPITDELGYVALTEKEQAALRDPATTLARRRMLEAKAKAATEASKDKK